MTCFMCSLTLFFFNDTATTEIYTLSLHDALPIWLGAYTVTLLWNFYSLTPWIGGVAAAALTVVVALVVAYPCSRFQVVGHYFALVTLAVGEVVRLLIIAERNWTSGALGPPLQPPIGGRLLPPP